MSEPCTPGNAGPAGELRERAAKAERIARDPGGFKVCCGCESIVARRADFCPNCHAYRFDASPEAVVEQARLLGRRERRSVIAEDLS